MTQIQLLMLVMAISAFFNFNTLRKLASPWSEAPAKSMLTLLLASGYVFATLQGATVSQWLSILLGICVVLYALSSFIVLSLGRANGFRIVQILVDILYWTAAGREPFYHLLAQIALQKGQIETAQTISQKLRQPDRLNTHIYLLQENWQAILTSPSRDADSYGLYARVRALLATDQHHEATLLVETLKARLDNDKTMENYRAYRLAQAYIFADKGKLTEVQNIFREGIPNTPVHIMLAILGQAAERAGQSALAENFYRDGYRYAPKGHETTFLAKLDGTVLPQKIPTTQQTYGTYTMLVFISLCYGLQVIFGNDVAHAIAGYINIPQEFRSEWWRYISYAFVHGNFLHFGMNMWVLFDIGRLYEKRRNWGNLLMAFIFGSVLGAHITNTIQTNNVLILVGASGGILGIAGALLADTLRANDQQNRQLRNSLLQWVVMIIVFSLAIPNVSLEGHVGGLIGGLLWGFTRQGISYSLVQYIQQRYQHSNSSNTIKRQVNSTNQKIDTVLGIVATISIIITIGFALTNISNAIP